MSEIPSRPPRGELFADPTAKVVWAAFLTLEEALKHQVLAAVQEHLAVHEDRSTPDAVRTARAVGALREAAQETRRSHARLTQNAYEALRRERPEAGWPPESSVRRWLAGAEGGSWNVALKRAGLEAVPEAEVITAHLGGAFTEAELVAAVREFVAEHGYVPGMREYIRWAKRPDVRQRLGRRPTSQPVFDRLFPGGWEAVIRATELVDDDEPVVTFNGGAARPAGSGWSTDTRRAALRSCADVVGRSPRTSEYMAWRNTENANRSGEGLPPAPLPSYTSFHTHYGSWDAALVDAGLQPLGGSATRSNTAVPRKTGPRVSDEALLDAMRQAFADIGHPFTTTAYADWTKQRRATDRASGRHQRYSSYATIITRFGSWAAACERALPREDA